MPVENEFKKLQTFDWSLFIGQSYLNNHGAKHYLINKIDKTITIFSCLKNTISEWESKGLPNVNVYLCSKCKCLFKTGMNE